MKVCSVCQTPKEEIFFSKHRARPDGLRSSCKDCDKTALAKIGEDGFTSRQRFNAKNPDYFQKKGEDGLNHYQRNYRKNPGRKKKSNLLRKYGLTVAGFERMLEEQDNACAICRGVDKKWSVDHDHTTGKVRAILCHRCNIGIGNLGDSAKIATAAAAYLAKHEKT